MKKIISLLLVVVLVFSFTPSGFAEEIQKANRLPLDDALALAHEMYPGANVYIDGNDVIHVVVTGQSQQTQVQPSIQPMASDYAPNGGSYRRFTPPAYWDPNAGIPYSMVYLPADQTAGLLSAKLTSSLIGTVINWLASYPASTVATMINNAYGLSLTPTAVLFIAGLGTYNAIQWIDTAALVSVTNQYSRIRITRLTIGGYPSNVYAGWTGSYVTDDPYSVFNPTFYRGVYDI